MPTATLQAPTPAARAPHEDGRIWTRPPALIKGLLAADLLIAALAVISHAIGQALGIGKIMFFRLGQENNLPTWYSSSQLLLVAAILSIYAILRREHTGRLDWRLLLAPAFFLLLSLDETASIHEALGAGLEKFLESRGSGTGMRVGAWTFIAGPLFLIGLVLLARLTAPLWRHHRRIKWKFLIGFALCFISAVGGELVMSMVPAESFIEKAETLLEETGEMIGVTIMVWAALDLLALERRKAEG